MSLLDVLRSGVKIADTVTKPLQAVVLFRRFVSADSEGTKTYVPPMDQPAIELPAIVEFKQQQVRLPSGVLSVSRSKVLFLDVAALTVATAGNGVTNFDLLVLPDGSSGPVLTMEGLVDAGDGSLIPTQLYLG